MRKNGAAPVVQDEPTEGAEPEAEVREDTLDAEPLPKTPVTLTLPCRITPDQKAEAAQKMAQAFCDLQDTQARKKEAASQYKAEEESLNGQINRFSQTIRSEFEHRPVDCERVIDYAQCEARTYRKDTGEIAQIRDLTASEMQTKMELEEAENSAEQEADTADNRELATV